MKVIKRNGNMVEFDSNRIEIAMKKAFSEVGCEFDASVIENVILKIKDNMNVEEIQDLVVYTMMENGYFVVANAYIKYREVQTYKRSIASESVLKSMSDIVMFGDDENSNKQYGLPSVARDTIAGVYFRNNLKNVLDREVYDAHITKSIHWHDSDVDPKLTNCCIFNIKDMLENGTRITNADIEKPKSVGVAMNIAMQIMASISASQYGGVSLPEFNEVFAEYAKLNFKKHFLDYYSFIYDKEFENEKIEEISTDNNKLKNCYEKVFNKAKEKTKKDIYDACQLFEYQTNSILGSASQTPFATITFSIPTSWESEVIVDSYLSVRMKGLGKKGVVAIFPKISMIVVDGLNKKETDKYFNLLEKASNCIAKTYYPDILNYTKQEYNEGRYYARMGCRSRVNHEYTENNSPVRMGRFNYGVVTLNLVQIALKSISKVDNIDDRIKMFFDILNTFGLNIMKKSFEERYKLVSKLKAKESPILFQYGGISRLEPDETIEKLLKTDRASLSYGFIGIDDCVRILTDDKDNISTEFGNKLGLDIIKTISEHASIIKKETGLPISLYGSPVEAGIHTMFQGDLKLYSDIMPDWLKRREYYTNSFHFSSELPIDAFDKIKIESEFVKFANGGNISYVENSGKVQNNMAIIELIQYANDIGTQYFAINTVSDVCYKCGFTGEIEYSEESRTYKCPHCGNTDGRDMKVQRRSCGYISNFNITHAVKGRMKEIKNRAKHI